MKIVNASARIIAFTPNLEQTIELAGRVCYKSEDRITDDSAFSFIRRLVTPTPGDNKHESVLEHGSITVHFVNDRGVSHEEVRHRISSFSQESTRYCNYSQGKFGGEITVVDIRGGFPEISAERFAVWLEAMYDAERHYLRMIELGASPQEARSVLPNSLKTELVWTANPREWLHIFRMRDHFKAHPQMIEVIRPLHAEFAQRWPAIFGD